MDNYDDNVEELDEASSSSSVNFKKPMVSHKMQAPSPEKVKENTGKAVEGAGKTTVATGKAVEGTGKAVEGVGKVAQKAGQLTQKAGQGIDKAGDSMLNAGKALSSSGYGAIAGVPLSILGGVTKAAGLGTQAVGKGTELAGKGTEAAGKGVKKAGQETQKIGDKVKKTGQTVRNNTQNKKGSITGTFSLKKLKRWLIVASVVASAVILFALMITSAVADMWPNFLVTTMTGGTTTYSKDDVPTDLTENGVDTWTNEQNKLFTELKKDKGYYDKGFSNYDASNILKNNDEQLDNSIVVATIHYQGTVNLTTFDKEYEEIEYDDGTTSSDYKGEPNVKNQHTRDFYEQAGEKVGNTFIMYPGTRMLLGYLVKNNVTFHIVEYKEWYEDGELYSNAGEVLSDWKYLGKITAESEEKAKQLYSVSGTIDNIFNDIVDNRDYCNKNDDWNAINKCYDVDTLYDEIFGEKFEIEDSSDIISYLEEKYDDENASVPIGTLRNGKNYIAVEVSKEIDYDLYEKYMKDVYIPYVYINCDNCGYKDESDEFKEAYSENIYGEIIEFVNAFKDLNDEELININYSTISHQCVGTATINVECTDSDMISIRTDYCEPGEDCKPHNANDINYAGNPPSVYPLIEGTVIKINNGCSNICPSNEASDYVNNKKGWYALSDSCRCGGGLGNYVIIESEYNGRKIYAKYAHMEYGSISVEEGQYVTLDTKLGTMGTTGLSTGNHLHIEFHYDELTSDKFMPCEIFTEEAIKSAVCTRKTDS